jgi:hypothetical protein
VQCVLRPIKKKKQTTSQRKKKKMKNFWKSLTAFVGASVLAISASMAQDSGALIDALVKKGVLSDQEAEEIRADLTREFATTSAGKLNIASHITQLKIYGDTRLRFEYDKQQRSGAGEDNRERQRNRVRVRVGADYQFTDGFKAGLRAVTTAGSGTSGNQTLGSSNTFAGGAFNTSNYSLFFDRFFLQYDKAFGFDWLTLVGGRQQFGHNLVEGFTLDGDVSPEGGLVKIGEFDLWGVKVSSTHGTYMYVDAGTDNNFGGPNYSDSWMMVNQVNIAYKFNKDWAIRLSPGFVNYVGSGDYSNGTTTSAGSVANPLSVSVEDLNVAVLNFELTNPLPWEMKGKLYADYGINLSGANRANSLQGTGNNGFTPTNLDADGRNQFFVAGYQVGKGKGKGAWTVDATYAYFETYSWDPNLVDSDFTPNTNSGLGGAGSLNQQGFGVKASYSFTDFLTGTVNYRHTTVIDNNATAPWVTQYTSATANRKTDEGDLVQVDLSWKF